MKPSTESHSTKKTSLEEIDLAWPEEETSGRAGFVSRLSNRFGIARRSSLLPEVGLPARPGLLVLTALLLIALCALLATWRFQPRPTEAGISLLADSSSSKLNNASAASAEAVAPTLTRELETPVKSGHPPVEAAGGARARSARGLDGVTHGRRVPDRRPGRPTGRSGRAGPIPAARVVGSVALTRLGARTPAAGRERERRRAGPAEAGRGTPGERGHRGGQSNMS